jgi:dolichyl-phosphate beta-glucosyltransferase
VTLTISYVLPVHNDASSIGEVVRRITERIDAYPGSEVVLIENASTDRSAAVIEGLADTRSTERVTVLSCRSHKGIGRAWRAGIPLTTGELVVLTASDLPFGFSDLDAALNMNPTPPLIIGSKAHPGSRVEVDRLRLIISHGFRLIRGVLLGLWQGDTQGSLLINGPLVRSLLPDLECADYLIATEIVVESVRRGVAPREVPIDYPRQAQRSTVSPLVDSLRMVAGLMRLRRRLRRRTRRGFRANGTAR